MNTHLFRFLFSRRSALMIALLLFLKPTPALAGGVVGSGTPGSCTESALDSALAGGGSVTFNCGGAASILIQSVKVISQTTTIDGGSQITLTGNLTTRLFTNSATLTLQNIILDRAGSTGSDGGAITNSGTLNLQNSTIQNSQTDNNHSGGAIFSSGPVNISNSTLKNNTGGSAGAMFINNALAVAQISNSTFSNNKTTNTITGFGGAIWVGEQAQVSITGGAIISNSAQYGGGLYLSANATVTLSSAGAPAIVAGNSATTSGGGVDNSGGHVTLTNVTFSGNSAGSGGGLTNDQVSGMATLTNVTLSSNSAAFVGGGIYNNHGTAMLANVIIIGNVVTNTFGSATYGGGIENYGTLTLTNSTLSGNLATGNFGGLSFGGGLYNNFYTSQDTATVINSTLSGNSAYAGGGILNVGTLTLTNSTLSANSATSTGGGIENYQGTAMVINVTLSGNSANTGGGIFQQGQAPTQTITLKNTILVSGPSGANCYEDPSSIGSLLSNGYNLTSEGTCAPYIHNTGDVNNENPNLGPLANNGGPTLTHMPQAGSPAIDHGSECPAFDQRGAARPGGPGCDIGAVEYGALLPRLYLPLILK